MSIPQKHIVRSVVYGLEAAACLLVLMVIAFSMLPVHAQTAPTQNSWDFEHRVTMSEDRIQALIQSQQEMRSAIASIQDKIGYVVGGVGLLLVKALVNIFMGTWFPQAKQIKD